MNKFQLNFNQNTKFSFVEIYLKMPYAEFHPLNFDTNELIFLFWQLGKIKSAQEDLDLAIKLEPMLIDSYWHRHLLFLLQNKKAEALSDLNAILKHNKKHAGAYRSR